eukprot:TRINITY_DN17301_c0_g2_i1.p1 TRINITY_DN17301_c0_g2~~TRINITY_DN17301_c0_g2_i1.p1  ORF type:complete len:1619 (+),score=542.14 TRINITY_DN17301_c0_g2_i1:60-4859(+)
MDPNNPFSGSGGPFSSTENDKINNQKAANTTDIFGSSGVRDTNVAMSNPFGDAGHKPSGDGAGFFASTPAATTNSGNPFETNSAEPTKNPFQDSAPTPAEPAKVEPDSVFTSADAEPAKVNNPFQTTGNASSDTNPFQGSMPTPAEPAKVEPANPFPKPDSVFTSADAEPAKVSNPFQTTGNLSSGMNPFQTTGNPSPVMNPFTSSSAPKPTSTFFTQQDTTGAYNPFAGDSERVIQEIIKQDPEDEATFDSKDWSEEPDWEEEVEEEEDWEKVEGEEEECPEEYEKIQGEEQEEEEEEEEKEPPAKEPIVKETEKTYTFPAFKPPAEVKKEEDERKEDSAVDKVAQGFKAVPFLEPQTPAPSQPVDTDDFKHCTERKDMDNFVFKNGPLGVGMYRDVKPEVTAVEVEALKNVVPATPPPLERELMSSPCVLRIEKLSTQKVGIKDTDGLVVKLQPNGVAEKAGVKTGMTMTKIGGIPVSTSAEVKEALAGCGDKFDIEIDGGSKEEEKKEKEEEKEEVKKEKEEEKKEEVKKEDQSLLFSSLADKSTIVSPIPVPTETVAPVVEDVPTLPPTVPTRAAPVAETRAAPVADTVPTPPAAPLPPTVPVVDHTTPTVPIIVSPATVAPVESVLSAENERIMNSILDMAAAIRPVEPLDTADTDETESYSTDSDSDCGSDMLLEELKQALEISNARTEALRVENAKAQMELEETKRDGEDNVPLPVRRLHEISSIPLPKDKTTKGKDLNDESKEKLGALHADMHRMKNRVEKCQETVKQNEEELDHFKTEVLPKAVSSDRENELKKIVLRSEIACEDLRLGIAGLNEQMKLSALAAPALDDAALEQHAPHIIVQKKKIESLVSSISTHLATLSSEASRHQINSKRADSLFVRAKGIETQLQSLKMQQEKLRTSHATATLMNIPCGAPPDVFGEALADQVLSPPPALPQTMTHPAPTPAPAAPTQPSRPLTSSLSRKLGSIHVSLRSFTKDSASVSSNDTMPMVDAGAKPALRMASTCMEILNEAGLGHLSETLAVNGVTDDSTLRSLSKKDLLRIGFNYGEVNRLFIVLESYSLAKDDVDVQDEDEEPEPTVPATQNMGMREGKSMAREMSVAPSSAVVRKKWVAPGRMETAQYSAVDGMTDSYSKLSAVCREAGLTTGNISDLVYSRVDLSVFDPDPDTVITIAGLLKTVQAELAPAPPKIKIAAPEPIKKEPDAMDAAAAPPSLFAAPAAAPATVPAVSLSAPTITITKQPTDKVGIKDEACVIVKLQPRGAAERCGAKVGMKITKVSGVSVTTSAELQAALKAAGQNLELEIDPSTFSKDPGPSISAGGISFQQPATGAFTAASSSATPAFGGFGASSSSTAPASGTSTSSSGFGAFGASSSSSAAPAFGAGTGAGTGAGGFGAMGSATSSSGFGAASSAPAFGAASSGGFGAASSAPAFGAATGGFGVSSSAPAFGGLGTSGFGAQPAPAAGGQQVLTVTKTSPAEKLGVKDTNGVVAVCKRGGAGDRAGLAPGMKIISIAGMPVNSSAEIKEAFKHVGQSFQVVVQPGVPIPAATPNLVVGASTPTPVTPTPAFGRSDMAPTPFAPGGGTWGAGPSP